MNINEHIQDACRDLMLNDIQEAQGNEVVWRADIGPDGDITHVKVLARGNLTAVPAILSELEKGAVVVHNHPSGDLRPSSADLSVASVLGNQGIGFFIVDNSLSDIYIVVEPIIIRDIVPLDDTLDEHLRENGNLARIFPDYSPRPSQQAMLELIKTGFNNDQIIIAEASTGVGKSLAYLLPALQWASQNEERVVVSTATITLQQQIMEKDIPLALNTLALKDLKVALIKGRGNYLCLKRLQETVDQGGLFDQDALESIVEWETSTVSGERSDLPVYIENNVWSQVCGESDICGGTRCPFYHQCYIMRAKKEANAAKVVVVNHHLLFADISLRAEDNNYHSQAVLPAYQRIIIDEAHNLENSAMTFYSANFNRGALFRRLNKLYRFQGKRALGALIELQTIINVSNFFDKILDIYDNIEKEWSQLSLLGEQFLQDNNELNLIDADDLWLHEFIETIKRLNQILLSICELITRGLDHITEENNNPIIVETNQILNGLENDCRILQEFTHIDAYDKEKVFWLSQRKDHQDNFSLTLHISPLSIAKELSSSLYSHFKTVVCTSATLSIKNSFDYWGNRVGLQYLSSERYEVDVFASPFDHEQRVLLAVPEDAPLPSNQEEFYPFVQQQILAVVEQSRGRALVLFTSYHMLKATYEAVIDEFVKLNIPLYYQGQDDKNKLLSKFKTETSSVLFATGSFWEGIDAPGETLSTTIICKLPFAPPNHPVLQARYKLLEASNRSAFFEISVPEAIMKFRQGCGRLMRSENDRGVLYILDSRLTQKNYGRLFIESLPPMQYFFDSSEQITLKIKKFLTYEQATTENENEVR